MINEVIDPRSGAILFKKDTESQKVDRLERELEILKQRVVDLEKLISILIGE